MKSYRVTIATLLFAALALSPALAILGHGPVWEATYIAAYQPTFGNQGVPYHGVMKLKFNHGIVTGTYTANSSRPDPLYGRIVQISGGVKESNVMLNFSVPGGFSVKGTIAHDGEISGTATIKGHFYTFLAKVKSSS